MTGDHHDRTARRATLLVTAADEILGTHSAAAPLEHDIAIAVHDVPPDRDEDP